MPALFPKKAKFRKWHTMRKNSKKKVVASRGTSVSFGSFGLKAMSEARVKSNQLEAARKACSRELGKNGRMWIRVFPDRPFTKKPAEVKLGKGKGDVQGYEVQVYPGRLLFEVDGVTDIVAKEALRKAGTKLPVKSKVVSRL